MCLYDVIIYNTTQYTHIIYLFYLARRMKCENERGNLSKSVILYMWRHLTKIKWYYIYFLCVCTENKYYIYGRVNDVELLVFCQLNFEVYIIEVIIVKSASIYNNYTAKTQSPSGVIIETINSDIYNPALQF